MLKEKNQDQSVAKHTPTFVRHYGLKASTSPFIISPV